MTALRSYVVCVLTAVAVSGVPSRATAESTRLLREPTLSATEVAFAYGADLWVVSRTGGRARRLTSTPAVERYPHFSPDGRFIAFTSNRSGVPAVYVVPTEGGTPTRLTWYPAPALVRGWSPDGTHILYASSRESAPTSYNRLWTVPRDGGPSTLLPAPFGNDGSFSHDGRVVVDRVSRLDAEWRGYRGGQNQPLEILTLDDLSEVQIPHEGTIDVSPVWLGDMVYFLSDRGGTTMNIWSFHPGSKEMKQLTRYDGTHVKSLNADDTGLVFEHDGWIRLLDPVTGMTTPLDIEVYGDFPWAERHWEDVSERATNASLSPTGQRALFEARGEIFTVPAKKGAVRNLTRSSGAADRNPVWSTDGASVAWVSDRGDGYELVIGGQDGLSPERRLSIGESKMAWEPAWSPDGSQIAFVDDDVRVRILELETGRLATIDTGGTNVERGAMGLVWSPDSKWLAYAKTFPNNLRRIMVWSQESGKVVALTDMMADAMAPAWDRSGEHLYFLASTDVALRSGWANTSTIRATRPRYGVYVAVLDGNGETPFGPESDDEGSDVESAADPSADESDPTDDLQEHENSADAATVTVSPIRIDLTSLERRIITVPMPAAHYQRTLAGPSGTVFVVETGDGNTGTIHKFSLTDREATVFAREVRQSAVSHDGSKILLRRGTGWSISGTDTPPGDEEGTIEVSLRMRLDRLVEWSQMFQEAWRYERDFFYDPGLHGAVWQDVRSRYAPLVPHVRHRADLSYVLDQMNGELAVGHSFVFGGDLPDVDASTVGLLGADLAPANGYWRIERIYTFESWNPELSAPLDRPGLRVDTGHYLVSVNGQVLTAGDDPFRLFDGTAGVQTVLGINEQPTPDGAWTVVVEPVDNERALRQRAWVEDNRRRVDELSDGRLGYVWVPNTGSPGVVSFDRYFFAQQDKLGAVIDERFNGGGLLDDYMVDLLTRRLRAAITNEVPEGRPMRLPAGILGPKVLLINEQAGSGGDYFAWVFRQQEAGPLIGTTTWGGLVKSSVHYPLIDGGSLTAPDNAVFDPVLGSWIAENRGVRPDIEVRQDTHSTMQGGDPQLERGVEELLRLLSATDGESLEIPKFPQPAMASPR